MPCWGALLPSSVATPRPIVSARGIWGLGLSIYCSVSLFGSFFFLQVEPELMRIALAGLCRTEGQS